MNSLKEQQKNIPTVVIEQLKPFELEFEKLVEIISRISHAFDRGLHSDPDIYYYSPIRMLPTHLSVVPSGTEKGSAYAIDLGGTNLRIFKVDMDEGHLESESFHFEVPASVSNNTEPAPLFDFIAKCLHDSLIKLKVIDTFIPLVGFTFSFPCNQRSLCSATLIRWTKGYKIDSVKGKDIVKLLKESCQKLNLKIGDFPLINDTTGTLMCGAFEDRDAVIGIINGTGTNACYIETKDRVKKWKGSRVHPQIIINTEWGAFGEHHELDDIITDYDRQIDHSSLNPGEQIFEKMMSGMYVGELARIIICDLINRNILFNGIVPDKIKTKGSFGASILSDSYFPEKLISIFKESFDVNIGQEEANIIAYVCDAVAVRTSRLTGAGLSALLQRVDRTRCVVAADGSMFRKHPKFVDYTTEVIHALLPDKNFKIILVDDGSGKGAALAAYVAASDIDTGVELKTD